MAVELHSYTRLNFCTQTMSLPSMVMVYTISSAPFISRTDCEEGIELLYQYYYAIPWCSSLPPSSPSARWWSCRPRRWRWRSPAVQCGEYECSVFCLPDGRLGWSRQNPPPAAAQYSSSGVGYKLHCMTRSDSFDSLCSFRWQQSLPDVVLMFFSFD